jgi:SAM-dependent methyltransferase
MTKCRICGSTAPETVLYNGPIRDGAFGKFTEVSRTILQCPDCNTARLPDETIDYSSEEYRASVDGSAEAARFYEKHDAELWNELPLFSPDALRGKHVADIGCGAGSLLDFLKGIAMQTVAVEPSSRFREELAQKGHRTYPFCKDAIPDWQGKIDQAVSLCVIEHVADPQPFLREIHRLLVPGGKLLLNTPNAENWMLDLLPEDYPPFFYRRVHNWYFTATGLNALAARCGFRVEKTFFRHRYDLSNLIGWLRDRRPTGTGKILTAPEIDFSLRQWLEQSGKADYLYVELIKD